MPYFPLDTTVPDELMWRPCLLENINLKVCLLKIN